MSWMKIDQPHLNRICATWTIAGKDVRITEEPITSPPFVLQSEGYAIPFHLILTCFRDHAVRVRRSENTRDARAIVTLFVKHSGLPPFVEAKVDSSWRDQIYFSDVGLPPPRVEKNTRYTYEDSVIKCYITWLGFTNYNSARKPVLHHPLCVTKLPYDNDVTPDVKLVIGDKEITAHKTILTVHSPVFMGMFQTPMKEAREGRVVIEDIDFDTMQVLVGMMYSGEDHGLEKVDTALKILAAAEKYQMTIVKKACEAKLQLNVGYNNAKRLFKEAEMYGAEELFRTCLEYVVVQKTLPFDEVKEVCMKQPRWTSMLIDLMKEKLEMTLCTRFATFNRST